MSPAALGCSIALAIWLLFFLRGLASLRRTAVLAPRPDAPLDASVTAIVPARDEAEVIEASVGALIAEEDRLEAILLVDDGSRDGTSEKLAALAEASSKLRVIDGVGPRRGECGKPAALVHALRTAAPASEWLLFVDADVVLEPGAIGALLGAAADSGADLVSVIPRIRMERAIESLVMPAIGALVLAQYPPERVARAGDPVAFANGQVILIRRRAYEAAGGHAAVIGEVLEDVRLAGRVKASGGRLFVADGRQIASTRMYSGWSEIAEGWSKNLFLLFDRSVARTVAWTLATVLLAWSGPILALWAGRPIGWLTYGAIVAIQMSLRALGGAAPAWALLSPVSSLLAAHLMVRSMRLHLRRGAVRWKGRTYRA